MQTRRRCLTGAIALAVMLSTVPVAAADKTSKAVAVTEQLLSNAYQAMEDASGTAQLRSAVDQAFAFDVWERFLLQKRAAEFNEEQRREIRTLLPGFLAYLYRDRFSDGMETAPSIGSARERRGDVIVSSQFTRENGGPLPVDWRLRDFEGQLLVIDIMVSGTSFLLLKRDEFTAVVDQGGSEALLTHMRERAL